MTQIGEIRRAKDVGHVRAGCESYIWQIKNLEEQVRNLVTSRMGVGND